MEESHGSHGCESEPILHLCKRRRLSNGETCLDHISPLPDLILQHILSFLPADDFIKTSVLSKRWRSVWAEVPVLSFTDCSDGIRPRFRGFISETLSNYRAKKVEKLDLCIKYQNSFRWLVDKSIGFATERRVEELKLSFNPKIQNSSSRYQLSQSIYSNSSLRILNTVSCNFAPSVSVSWTSLKMLTICYAKLSNDAISRILLGSPNLEYLTMQVFSRVDKIFVSSSNMKLKSLVLHISEKWLKSTLEISAPHIHSLTLSGSTRPRMIKLINLSSLMELILYLSGAGCESLTGLVGELCRVQELRVSSGSLKLLSKFQLLDSPLTLNYCKILAVDSSVKEWDFHRIVTLLQAIPNLEKLTITMDNSTKHEFEDKAEYWESMKTDVKCHHLESVLISGFEQSWCVGTRQKFFTSMIKFLLKTATVLKSIFIRATSYKTTARHETYELHDLSDLKKLISSLKSHGRG